MEKNKSAVTQYNNAKLWQIGFFSLNNCATNIAMFLMMQYSYFTQNVLGLAAAIVGLIATGTRIFDAVTDPLVGFLVDRTNGRFGTRANGAPKMSPIKREYSAQFIPKWNS